MPACAGGGGAARDHGCRLARVGEPRASRHCDGVGRADADRFQQAAGSRSHSSLFDCARGRWARSLRVRERWNSESCGWSAGAQCQCKLSTPRARVWQGATKLEEELKCAGALEAWAHASSALHCVLQSKLHTQKFAHATPRLLIPSALLDGTSSSPGRACEEARGVSVGLVWARGTRHVKLTAIGFSWRTPWTG